MGNVTVCLALSQMPMPHALSCESCTRNVMRPLILFGDFPLQTFPLTDYINSVDKFTDNFWQ